MVAVEAEVVDGQVVEEGEVEVVAVRSKEGSDHI